MVESVPEKTQPHWLQFTDKESGLWGHAKWDGCVEVNLPNDLGFVHVCDLGAFVKQLEEIRDAAKRHFGEDWE